MNKSFKEWIKKQPDFACLSKREQDKIFRMIKGLDTKDPFYEFLMKLYTESTLDEIINEE